MLGEIVTSSYQQYKQDTDAVASWLAITAEKYGYTDRIKNNRNRQVSSQVGDSKGKPANWPGKQQQLNQQRPQVHLPH